MSLTERWQKEPGPRVAGSRALDQSKVQAPGVVRLPDGGYRLFYTAVGPGKPYPACQGYVLSAVSEDGVTFEKEPGIRFAPRPDVRHVSLRVLAPSVTPTDDGGWRMYVEARGPASVPTVICSAISSDMLTWELEAGVRLESPGGVGAPRYLRLPDGRGRLYCFDKAPEGAETEGEAAEPIGVVSAVTANGLDFEMEPGVRVHECQEEMDSGGITAAEVIPPTAAGAPWTMFYSAWQDVAPGTDVPVHPSANVNAETDGASEDFAAASIAVDMAGFRSRIFVSESPDGLAWGPGRCVIEGGGYDADGLDAVHAEDMSLTRLDDGRYRI